MPHSKGYNAHTRSCFAQKFRHHGQVHPTTLNRVFRIGEYVDIQANGSVQRGMPHRYYHGKTGIVFDVTEHALGVEVNKCVNGRIIKKRIHVRTEHVRPSKCRLDFLARVKSNDVVARSFKEADRKPEAFKLCKRQVKGPRPGHIVISGEKNPARFMRPLPYDTLI